MLAMIKIMKLILSLASFRRYVKQSIISLETMYREPKLQFYKVMVASVLSCVWIMDDTLRNKKVNNSSLGNDIFKRN